MIREKKEEKEKSSVCGHTISYYSTKQTQAMKKNTALMTHYGVAMLAVYPSDCSQRGVPQRLNSD